MTWVDRCLFPNNFEKELIELGVDKETTLWLKLFIRSKKDHNKEIVELYQGFIDSKSGRKALVKYLNFMYKKWENLK